MHPLLFLAAASPGSPGASGLASQSAPMSGTLRALTPDGYGVVSLAGVIHWCVLPSLIHTVLLPWRWTVARFSVYLLPAVPGNAGPTPEPATVSSTGRKRSPPAPLGSRL